MISKRQFLTNTGKLLSLSLVTPVLPSCMSMFNSYTPPFFDISLAQWSMHRQLRSGHLKVVDFVVKTQKVFDIYAVEYVNQFFKDKATDRVFLSALKTRADDLGVKNLLIMIDAEGDLGDPDSTNRTQAIENHYKWVEAASYLKCHSIRVNAMGPGSKSEVQKACVDGLRRLAEFSQEYNINVIVENHGGYSSDGQWLADIMREVNLSNCGTLPDFGNFGDYDKYQGVKDMLPFAKGISAKSFEFDMAGNEIYTDFHKMLKIIKAGNYNGYIGIEFEGTGDEDNGILATKNLLMAIGRILS